MRDNGKSEPIYWQPVMPRMAAMRKQALNFIAAVQGIRPAPCTSREAVEDLKLAENYIRYKAQYQN